MSQDNFNVVQSDTLYDECLIAKKIYGRFFATGIDKHFS